MYRVFDTKENKWVREGIYLSPNDDLNQEKNTMFSKKLSLIPDCRYAVTKDIGLIDKNESPIYEGDILRSEQDDITGEVAYVPEIAAYVLLDYRTSKYYSLGVNICKERLSIIGNTFENPELLKPTNIADAK